MIIRNVRIIGFGHDGRDVKNVFVTLDGRMEMLTSDATSKHSYQEIDAAFQYTLMPGMLDSHVHGHGGPDFADAGNTPDVIGVIAESLGKTGLSYAMATLVSSKLPALADALKAIDQYVVEQANNPTPGRTQFVGVHLEGPFIAKNCKGAHALDALQDSIDIETFKLIINNAPHIKEWKITLAPDLPGAMQFMHDIKQLEVEGTSIKVFVGHSNPPVNAIEEAVKAGVSGFTHLGNACMETCCREVRTLERKDAKSNVVSWVLNNPDTCPNGVELIVDGVHLSQSFVRLVKETLGDKIVLVTDALGPAGLVDGVYRLGELGIVKEGNNFYLEDEKAQGKIKMKEGMLPSGVTGLVKSLAGSASPLSACVETYADWTVKQLTPLERMQAIYAAVVHNPRVTSLSKQAIDSLPESKNFVMIDQAGRVVMSLCQGKIVQHDPRLLPLQQKDGLASLLGMMSVEHQKVSAEKKEMTDELSHQSLTLHRKHS